MIPRISHLTSHISHFIFILLLLASCSDPKAEEKKLSEEVMTAHDRSMMLMDEMNTLELKLTDVLKKDSLQPTAVNALKDLKSANEGMMDWMHGFNADYRPTYDKVAAEYGAKLAHDWLRDHGVK